jgi:hypothetical protein
VLLTDLLVEENISPTVPVSVARDPSLWKQHLAAPDIIVGELVRGKLMSATAFSK